VFAGFGLVLLLDKLQVTKEHVSDIDDSAFVKDHAKAVSSQKTGKI